MTYRLRNCHTDQDILARLETIRLSARELAEARIHLMRAEAIADFIHWAWTASKALARRVGGAIAHKSIALANAYAESALSANARKLDAYLAQATDTADLERRLRLWHAPRCAPLAVTRP